LNINQLSLTVTVSLTHQRISLLQFSNRRSFNRFHFNNLRTIRANFWCVLLRIDPG